MNGSGRVQEPGMVQEPGRTHNPGRVKTIRQDHGRDQIVCLSLGGDIGVGGGRSLE